MDISALSPGTQELIAMAGIPAMLNGTQQEATNQLAFAISDMIVSEAGGDTTRLALSSAKLKERKELAKIEQDNLDREQIRKHRQELHEINVAAVQELNKQQARRMAQPRPPVQPQQAQPATATVS